MKKSKQRTKNLLITINNALDKRGSDGEKIFNDIFGLNFGIRKRKNFSLILLAGLSALLCALYYTTYYPGPPVWTLRFGVTSFTRNNNATAINQQLHNHFLQHPQRPESAVEVLSSEVFNNNRPQQRNKYEGGEGFEVASSLIKNKWKGNSVFDGNPGSPTTGGGDGIGASEGESGETSREVNTPREWNWKYWASLGYWKVYFNDSANDYDSSGKLPVLQAREEESADGTKNSQLYTDIPSSATFPSPSSLQHSSKQRKDVKATNFKEKRKEENKKVGVKGEDGKLACKFPRLNPFDPSITEFLKSPPNIDCSQNHPLVFRTNFRNKLIQWGHPFLQLTTEEVRNVERNSDGRLLYTDRANYTCCYKTITRGNGSDHNIMFSRRCYPILKAETEIPAQHEFIYLRCRSVPFNNNLTRPSLSTTDEGSKRSESFNNDSARSSGTSNNDYSNNNGNTTPSSIITKVYKDMMAFVPLKPWVEDRIRKYEESKRKFIYARKKKASDDVAAKNYNRKEENRTKGNIKQKQYLDINLAREKGNYQKETKQEQIPNIAEKGEGELNEMKTVRKTETVSAFSEDRLSVVILGLDAQSHMNFIRQMPLTYKYLTTNLSGIGLHGYTKVGDNTFPNVVAMLGGLTEKELEKGCWPTKDSYFDGCQFIWKKFAESGYRTSLAEDSVWMGTFNYDKKGFLHPPTDYYLHPLSLLMAKKIGHETWANAKLCYGPRLAFEVLLEYIVKTAVTFRDSLYFQFVWSNSLFHDYLNNPRLGDELLAMTLEFLKTNGFLNNTAFILVSDHGIRWGSIRSTYQGKIEERMPFAYFTFPAWFRKKYPTAMRNLQKNAFRLTTPFDVHETLQDLLSISQGKLIKFDRWRSSSTSFGKSDKSKSTYKQGVPPTLIREDDKKPPRGISLFRPIPTFRTCALAGIVEHWCVCHSMRTVPINSSLVQSGAQFIVQVINGLVQKHSGLCAKLSLFKINEAKRKIDGDIDRGLDVDFFVRKSRRKRDGGGIFSGDVHSSRSESDIVNTAASQHQQQLSHSFSSSLVVDKIYSSLKKGTSLTNYKYSKTDDDSKKAQKEDAGESIKGINNSNYGKVLNSTLPLDKTTTVKGEVGGSDSLSTSSDIKKMIQLQITLVTRPGDAVFEATIYGEAVIGNSPVNDEGIHQEVGQRSRHHWKLAGDISRLNLYGQQSACVKDHTVQKYCYCHNLTID